MATHFLRIQAELIHTTDDGIVGVSLLIPKAGSKHSFISVNVTTAEVLTATGMTLLLDVLNTDQEITHACEALIIAQDKERHDEQI